MRRVHFYLIAQIIAVFLFTACNKQAPSQSKNEKEKNTLTENQTSQCEIKRKDTPPQTKACTKTSDSPKVKQIEDFLKGIEVLEVPLQYTFESDVCLQSTKSGKKMTKEMISLLDTKKIYSDVSDMIEGLYISYQLNLSNNFKTLILSYEDGGAGFSTLINYTNSFDVIDFKQIFYDDYAEGWHSEEGVINNNKITIESWSYDDTQPNNDRTNTLVYSICDDGKITEIKKKEKTTIEVPQIDHTKVHTSLKEYSHVEKILKTKKFLIRIDYLKDGKYRYASWSKDREMTEQPDLILTNGQLLPDGTGGNHQYLFRNGKYHYTCYIQPLRGHNDPPAKVWVDLNDQRVLFETAEILK